MPSGAPPPWPGCGNWGLRSAAAGVAGCQCDADEQAGAPSLDGWSAGTGGAAAANLPPPQASETEPGRCRAPGRRVTAELPRSGDGSSMPSTAPASDNLGNWPP